MKPLTGWPRKGSVLPPLRATWRNTWPSFAYIPVWVNDPMTIDNEDIRTMYEAREDTRYRWWQQLMTDLYREGIPNAGLSARETDAIRWMAGTPQFLSHSRLQIVPITDQQFAELEWWLERERELRAEFHGYWWPAPLLIHERDDDLGC